MRLLDAVIAVSLRTTRVMLDFIATVVAVVIHPFP